MPDLIETQKPLDIFPNVLDRDEGIILPYIIGGESEGFFLNNLTVAPIENSTQVIEHAATPVVSKSRRRRDVRYSQVKKALAREERNLKIELKESLTWDIRNNNWESDFRQELKRELEFQEAALTITAAAHPLLTDMSRNPGILDRIYHKYIKKVAAFGLLITILTACSGGVSTASGRAERSQVAPTPTMTLEPAASPEPLKPQESPLPDAPEASAVPTEINREGIFTQMVAEAEKLGLSLVDVEEAGEQANEQKMAFITGNEKGEVANSILFQQTDKWGKKAPYPVAYQVYDPDTQQSHWAIPQSINDEGEVVLMAVNTLARSGDTWLATSSDGIEYSQTAVGGIGYVENRVWMRDTQKMLITIDDSVERAGLREAAEEIKKQISVDNLFIVTGSNTSLTSTDTWKSVYKEMRPQIVIQMAHTLDGVDVLVPTLEDGRGLIRFEATDGAVGYVVAPHQFAFALDGKTKIKLKQKWSMSVGDEELEKATFALTGKSYDERLNRLTPHAVWVDNQGNVVFESIAVKDKNNRLVVRCGSYGLIAMIEAFHDTGILDQYVDFSDVPREDIAMAKSLEMELAEGKQENAGSIYQTLMRQIDSRIHSDFNEKQKQRIIKDFQMILRSDSVNPWIKAMVISYLRMSNVSDKPIQLLKSGRTPRGGLGVLQVTNSWMASDTKYEALLAGIWAHEIRHSTPFFASGQDCALNIARGHQGDMCDYNQAYTEPEAYWTGALVAYWLGGNNMSIFSDTAQWGRNDWFRYLR